jgi:hypothetical protein
LVGFFLRPGFGYPLDDFRLKDFWKLFLSDATSRKHNEVQLQQWICLRRISGGLNKGQQSQLANEWISQLLTKRGKLMEIKSRGEEYLYTEMLRALASLELIETSLKERIGEALVDKIASGTALECDYWALGRIGARHLVYGSVANVVSRASCHRWLEKLLPLPPTPLLFVYEQLGRKTEQREINISSELINQILISAKDLPEIDRLKTLLTQEEKLSSLEQTRLLGDQLPSGLFVEI